MRLIDADALIAQMEADAEHMDEPIAKMFTYAAINDVKHAPTIEECKAGKWVHLGGDEWCCDKCGHVITTEGSWEHPHDIGAKYCENCGADTRGKQDE